MTTFVPSATDSAAPPSDVGTALNRFIPEVLRVTGTPGLRLAVSGAGTATFEAGYGWADVRGRRPMTASTITRGGSLAKVYIATAVMQLVESNQVSLDEPVRRYIPELPIRNPLGDREITVRDLLTLTAGLAAEFAGSHLGDPPSLVEYLERAFREERLSESGGSLRRWTNKVGTAYRYSNLAAATLGYLVEAVNPERLKLSEYVRQHILVPLGKASTYLPPVQDVDHVPASILGRISTGYVRYRGRLLPSPQIDPAAYPAASLLTTPGDHLRLLLAFQLDGPGVLEPWTARAMLTPQVAVGDAADPRALWTGLGWRMTNLDSTDRYFGHEGAHSYGWWNDGRVYPRRQLALAAFTNSWDMMQWHLPFVPAPTEIVIDYLMGWFERRRRRIVPAADAAPWAWKVSYLMGFLTVERLAGLLGIAAPHPSAIAQEMIDGSLPTGRPDVGPGWDDDAFRQGFSGGGAVDPTPDGLRSFLQSSDLKVSGEELPLLTLDVGGLGNLPVPLVGIWSEDVQWRGPA